MLFIFAKNNVTTFDNDLSRCDDQLLFNMSSASPNYSPGRVCLENYLPHLPAESSGNLRCRLQVCYLCYSDCWISPQHWTVSHLRTRCHLWPYLPSLILFRRTFALQILSSLSLILLNIPNNSKLSEIILKIRHFLTFMKLNMIK